MSQRLMKMRTAVEKVVGAIVGCVSICIDWHRLRRVRSLRLGVAVLDVVVVVVEVPSHEPCGP